MTCVHVITHANRHFYEESLEQFHRLRHQIFVEERGWSGLRQPDGLEVDAYDNQHAVYLLAIDAGRLVGGQRLYPTLLPHMISEVFPHLAQLGVPQAADILEWTRYFVVKERRTGRTDCRLLAAMQEFCLGEGITEVTAVVEMWWLPRWQQAGFKVRPLGLPQLIEGQPCIAAAVEISQASLEHVRKLAGLRGASLIRNGLSSRIHQVPHVAA
ncbi:acyl-homoserine-lactone synthase [Microvirga guangxiensis]|uniref:Acyl-homoserine-lactone synthase n=1 Tax=Microvirga guangxiensis TaxID=549386 RepID=A0A1G5CQD6_9HYPH|nr:acyl-homoserine-lactone synthase [Microvirga guangxiensis]SCY04460.1 acyl-homoserine lactone synthase [Microvirga guangxiensis]